MPRLARLDAPGLLHHIMIRGIERRKIFLNSEDYEDFLERLAMLLPETKTACYAWVLIPNHAHFLFCTGVVPYHLQDEFARRVTAVEKLKTTMHLKSLTLLPEKYPTRQHYPFNQQVFHQTRRLEFKSPVTLFVGENGSGKSTLLEALCHKCGIHIWREAERTRFEVNPYEGRLYHYLTVEWTNSRVPGSFFGSDVFRYFADSLDEWAAADPGMLDYFGGKSLVTQSHGQSLLSFFRARYRLKGLYLLDEPETALSPRSQLELVKILRDMSQAGHAQFIVATHSPILLACPDAAIFSFNHIPVKPIAYEETDHYQLYKGFMQDRHRFLGDD